MKKVFIGVLVFLILLIGLAIATPFLFKDKIVQVAYKQVEKYVDAKTDIKKIDLSLLKNISNFPNIALNAKDIVILNNAPFEGDTLLSIGNISLSLDIKSVLKGEQYKIDAIELSDVYINAQVNKDSIANWNILKPQEKEDKESQPFSLALNKFELNNININYDNQTNGQVLSITHLQHSGKGDFTDDILDYNSKTTIDAVNYKQNLISLVNDLKIKLESKVNINQKENKYLLDKNSLYVNDLKLDLDGMLQLVDSTQTKMDLSFDAAEADFKSFLSLIPALYSKDFNKIKTSGKLKLDGNIKGILQGESYPSFNVNLNIDNAQFQYPDLPSAVTDIFINAKINNKGGSLDNTIIDISKLNLKIDNEPTTAKLYVSQPISNPNIDLQAKGKLNLAKVKDFYPMEEVKTLKGNADINLNLKAKLSDIDNKQYQNIQASGNIAVLQMQYETKEVAKPINIPSLLLSFSPQFVSVDKCDMKIGESDFSLKGKLENYISYILSNKGTIDGQLDIVSNYINANEFLPEQDANTTKTKSQQAKEVVRLPKNVRFKGNTNINKLLYDKLTINNLNGNINLADEQINLNNLNANLLGGNAIVSGYYSTKPDIPVANLTYKITSFDFKQSFDYLGLFQSLAPIFSQVQGSFSSNMNINTTIQPDLSPNMNSLSGIAGFNINHAFVKNVEVFKKITALTNLEGLDNIELNNISINTVVKDGKVLIEPFELPVKDMKLTIGGAQGLDKSLDYDIAIDIPWDKLGKASTMTNSLLAKNPIPGLNGLHPDVIRFNFDVGGNANSPTVKMLKPSAAIGGQSVKEAMKESFTNQIKNSFLGNNTSDSTTSNKSVKEQLKDNFLSGGNNNDSVKTTPTEQIKQGIKGLFKNK